MDTRGSFATLLVRGLIATTGGLGQGRTDWGAGNGPCIRLSMSAGNRPEVDDDKLYAVGTCMIWHAPLYPTFSFFQS